MRRSIAAALTLLVSVAAVACGGEQDRREGGSEAEPPVSSYERTVRTVHTDMDDAMAAAFGSGSLDAELVHEARTTAEEARTRLDQAAVPARYRPAHEEYTRGLETFVDILEDVETQVDDPDVARRHLGDKRFSTGVGHLERASELYSEAGLDLDASAATG